MDTNTFDRVYTDCRARDMTPDDADALAHKLARTTDTHAQTLAKALLEALAALESTTPVCTLRVIDRARAALAAAAETIQQPAQQPDDGEREDVTLTVISRRLTDASTAYDMTLSQDGRTIYFALTESRMHMIGAVARDFAKLIQNHTTARVNGGAK